MNLSDHPDVSDVAIADIPSELAAYLTARSGVAITVEELHKRFYFYAFEKFSDDGNSYAHVLAIDASHPKGEKWLRIGDGKWALSQRLKF